MPKLKLKQLEHRARKYIELDGHDYVIDKKETKNPRSRNKAEVVLTCRKVKSKEYEETVNEMAEQLSKKVNTKEVVIQALYEIPYTILMKMKKELSKPKPRIRNRKGCAMLSIGGENLYLRD